MAALKNCHRIINFPNWTNSPYGLSKQKKISSTTSVPFDFYVVPYLHRCYRLVFPLL